MVCFFYYKSLQSLLFHYQSLKCLLFETTKVCRVCTFSLQKFVITKVYSVCFLALQKVVVYFPGMMKYIGKKLRNVSCSFPRLYFIAISILFHSYLAFCSLSSLIYFILISFLPSYLLHCLPKAISLVLHSCVIACSGEYIWYFISAQCYFSLLAQHCIHPKILR